MLAAPRDQASLVEPRASSALDPLHAKEQGLSETPASEGSHIPEMEYPSRLSGTINAPLQSQGSNGEVQYGSVVSKHFPAAAPVGASLLRYRTLYGSRFH